MMETARTSETLVNSSIIIALIMEAGRTSEMLVNFYQTTRRYNPEDSHLECVCFGRAGMFVMALGIALCTVHHGKQYQLLVVTMATEEQQNI
jgi:hypothetical protein